MSLRVTLRAFKLHPGRKVIRFISILDVAEEEDCNVIDLMYRLMALGVTIRNRYDPCDFLLNPRVDEEATADTERIVFSTRGRKMSGTVEDYFAMNDKKLQYPNWPLVREGEEGKKGYPLENIQVLCQ